MATYTLYFTTNASSAVTVEADDLESAIEKAYDRLPYNVCAQCAGAGYSAEAGIDLAGDWELDEHAYEDYPE